LFEEHLRLLIAIAFYVWFRYSQAAAANCTHKKKYSTGVLQKSVPRGQSS